MVRFRVATAMYVYVQVAHPNEASPEFLFSSMEVMEEEASAEDGLVLEMHLDMPPSLRGVADLDLRVH